MISDDEDIDDSDDIEEYYKDTSYNTQYVCLLLCPFTTDVHFQKFLKFVYFSPFC